MAVDLTSQVRLAYHKSRGKPNTEDRMADAIDIHRMIEDGWTADEQQALRILMQMEKPSETMSRKRAYKIVRDVCATSEMAKIAADVLMNLPIREKYLEYVLPKAPKEDTLNLNVDPLGKLLKEIDESPRCLPRDEEEVR